MMKLTYLGLAFALCASANAQVTFIPNSNLLTGNYGSPACVVDMNGDHLDDVVRMDGSVLTIDYQQANGQFIHQDHVNTSSSGLWSICAGDLNNDGLNDVLLGDGQHVEILHAVNGGAQYSPTYYSDYIFSQRSTMSDIDNDGWLDAFVCHDVDQSHPYRNDGSGALTEDQSLIPTGSSPEGGNYAAIWVDFDNDKDQDLYITKCRAGAPITDEQRINQMYRNDNGTFNEVAGMIGLRDSAQSWSTVFEDFDNDGDFDAFIVNHTDKNRFMINDGNGNFTDIITSTGIDANDLGAWEAQAADFNNDGFIDIFSEVGGGLYINNGNLTFTDQSISPDEGGIGDLNNDGWLDYQMGGTAYLNAGGSNHWVKVELDGIISAQNGIGSRVSIYGSWGVQIREVRSGQGFSHMNSLQVHFGLGSDSTIDSLIVEWPSGFVTNIANPSADQLHIIPEVDCILPPFSITVSGNTTFCPGDSVTLSAPNGYSAYQWSNGLTTQSITVTDAGNYNALGFNGNNCAAMSDQVIVNVIQETQPIIDAPYNLSFCAGDNLTLTANSTLPYTWSSGGSFSGITVNTTGDYWLTATGQCGAYNSDTVSVTAQPLATDPITNDVFLPAPGTATLNAIGSNIEWYGAAVGGNSIGSGNSWQTPVVNQTTTYYAEAREIYAQTPQIGGRSGVYAGGGVPASGGKLQFTATTNFTIETVEVYAITGGNRTIELQNAGGGVLASTTVNIPVGVHTVTLNFAVAGGSNYMLACLENDLFRHNTGNMYPYPIGDMGSVIGSTNGPSFYYFFYDWVVAPEPLECTSNRVPAVVDITTGVNDLFSSELSIFPNPSAGQITIFSEKDLGWVTLSVTDVSGSIVENKTIRIYKGNNSLNLSGLAEGLYVLQVDSSKGSFKTRVSLVNAGKR